MNKTLLSLGSALAFVSGATVAAGEAQAALTFETGNVQCDYSTSLDVLVTNDTPQTIAKGLTFLGTGGLANIFVGHHDAIAPGATVSVEMSGSSPWACNDSALKLTLKAGNGNFVIPGVRETTMAKIQVPPIFESASGVEMRPDPPLQYHACDETEGTVGVETWVNTFFPAPTGTKFYRFSGGLESPWRSFTASFGAHSYRNLIFWLQDDVCPRVSTPFMLEVDTSLGTDEGFGTVAPHWEIVSGSLAL